MLKNYLKLIIAIVLATNTMAQNVPTNVPTNGLVGWWPFNGNANDESGSGLNGISFECLDTTDRFGNNKSAFYFDGKNDYVQIKHSDKLNHLPFSISFWMKSNEQKGFGKVFNKACCSSWNGWDIQIENSATTNSGTWHFEYYNAPCKGIYQTYCSPVNFLTIESHNDKWHHCVLTIDSTFAKVYWDNVLIHTQKWDGDPIAPSTNLPLDIGRYGVGNIGFYQGLLDDIGIWTKALTIEEIKQLFEGCTKETATSSSLSSAIYSNTPLISLSAIPSGGTFSGKDVINNTFDPSKVKLGKNTIKYNFKNSTGCSDSTDFSVIVSDTIGNTCSTYDTLKIKVQLTTGIKSGQIVSMNVYPNPTSDVVIIETSDIAALNGYSYKMVDLQGKQVYKELVTKSKTEISLKSIGAKGVYILHVEDAQGISIENKKIVLE